MLAINVEETTMRAIRQQSPVQIMTYQKQMKNVEYFSYLGSMMPWKKQHSVGRRLFTSEVYLNFREKLVKCYI
jgi:hypothetical protein